MRLLVCDLTPASPSLPGEVLAALRADGFEIDAVSSASEATWRAAETLYTAVLLASATPRDNAAQLAAIEALRAAGVTTAIIVVASGDDPTQELRALDVGADDHVRAPINPGLLLARIHALGRRTDARPMAPLRAGPYELDASHLVAVAPDGVRVELTQREFAVIQLLARRAPHPVDKLAILDAVWGFDFDGDPNVVEVYVGYLRKKLGRSTIHTVRGVGYRAGGA